MRVSWGFDAHRFGGEPPVRLAGVVVDTDSQEWFFNLEAERRIGEHFVAEARLRLFKGDRQLNQLYAFDRDDYFQLSFTRFF